MYVCMYGHSQKPLRLVVDNHETEQAQFPDYPSLESEWAFNNAESGHRSKHVRNRCTRVSNLPRSFLEIGNAG